MGRDKQLGRSRDEPESRQEHARAVGEPKPRPEEVTEAPAERPPSEIQAEADLLKTSGGDPFTQESD